jgi:hypothetical protein
LKNIYLVHEREREGGRRREREREREIPGLGGGLEATQKRGVEGEEDEEDDEEERKAQSTSLVMVCGVRGHI